ncbi:hypothetical protein ACS0TY_003891 [Phlomoides rotata]
MAIRMPVITRVCRQIVGRFSFAATHIPKGCFAVYVGEEGEKKRFVIPISFLRHPSFQELLNRAEDEFGFHHPMGGLTLPCTEELFIYLISKFSRINLT